MKTLQEIFEFARRNNACGSQLNKFKELVDANKKLLAWQTVLGNFDWLQNNGCGLPILEVETLAKGIGKTSIKG